MGLVCAVSAFLLKDFGWKGVPVLGLICFIGILSFAGNYLFSVKDMFLEIGSDHDISSAAGAILKIVGVGYLAGIVADVCRELGEAATASAVVFIGRIEIIAIATPFFQEVVRLGMELIG